MATPREPRLQVRDILRWWMVFIWIELSFHFGFMLRRVVRGDLISPLMAVSMAVLGASSLALLLGEYGLNKPGRWGFLLSGIGILLSAGADALMLGGNVSFVFSWVPMGIELASRYGSTTVASLVLGIVIVIESKRGLLQNNEHEDLVPFQTTCGVGTHGAENYYIGVSCLTARPRTHIFLALLCVVLAVRELGYVGIYWAGAMEARTMGAFILSWPCDAVLLPVVLSILSVGGLLCSAWLMRRPTRIPALLISCLLIPYLASTAMRAIVTGMFLIKKTWVINTVLMEFCIVPLVVQMGFAGVILGALWGSCRKGAEPRCLVCGYLLLGLTSSVCPECGTPFDLQHAPR